MLHETGHGPRDRHADLNGKGRRIACFKVFELALIYKFKMLPIQDENEQKLDDHLGSLIHPGKIDIVCIQYGIIAVGTLHLCGGC